MLTENIALHIDDNLGEYEEINEIFKEKEIVKFNQVKKDYNGLKE